MFSEDLQKKINFLKEKQTPIQLGSIPFSSHLLLAPMSAICNSPFRLLMEELGAGGTVSELVSCHGINYKNERTFKMLYIDPREKNVGIQLFGENAEAMAKSAEVACIANDKMGGRKPDFIDINMGCPVRKVVSKGGGSALLKDTTKLSDFFQTIKKSIDLPLTIKIRTGWDEDSINAAEVANIAYNEGIEFLAVHGRTRTQAYKGKANWDLLEQLALDSKLPFIGNGDLHTAAATSDRLGKTNCKALMLGRGPLRNPFIFLESLEPTPMNHFHAGDYLEIIKKYIDLLTNYNNRERTILIQTRKLIVWFAYGFPKVNQFREQLFTSKTLDEVVKYTEDFFLSLQNTGTLKEIDHSKSFMAGGHG